MAAFYISTTFLLALFVVTGAEQALVRRQAEEQTVKPEKHGSKEVEAQPHSHSLLQDLQSPAPTTVTNDAGVYNTGAMNPNPVCHQDNGWDFVMGVNNSNDCADTTHHQHVDTIEMCHEAARRAHGHVPSDGSFVIPEAEPWKDDSPMRCFMKPCDVGGTLDMCFYFNPTGATPKRPTGVPICQRRNFRAGTENTNGYYADAEAGTNDDCPEGYRTIIDETECEVAADCLGHGKGAPFRVAVDPAQGGETQHDDYPEGCFVHEAQITYNNLSMVYYNSPLYSNGTARVAKPAAPRGTPLCNVSKVIKCSGHVAGVSNATCHMVDGNALSYLSRNTTHTVTDLATAQAR